MNNEILNSAISVLVQGRVDETNTSRCISSIRKYFPNAELILSTWKGERIDGLDYDKICVLDDPGMNHINHLGNTNREFIGRKNGLELCTHPYTLIIRSDSEIINLNFI